MGTMFNGEHTFPLIIHFPVSQRQLRTLAFRLFTQDVILDVT